MSRSIEATIRGGVAVSDDFADLPDGTRITAVIDPPVDDFEMTPELEAELEARAARVARGEFVTAEALLRRLDARRATPSR